MKKININKDWLFTLEDGLDAFNEYGFRKYGEAGGAAARFYPDSSWKRIDLPYDHTLDLKRSPNFNTSNGAYPNSHYDQFKPEHRINTNEVYATAWYRRSFFVDNELRDKRIFVEFEGVYRDAVVFVNGVYLDRHTSGYTSFAIELTDHLFYGEENSLAVRVDSDQPEGWWYDGAGIYRNVSLLVCEPVYFKYNKTAVRTEQNERLIITSTVVNDTDTQLCDEVELLVLDKDGNTAVSGSVAVCAAPYSETDITSELSLKDARLWSLEEPYLYTLRASIGDEAVTVRFGVRTAEFDTERGFLLNGKPTKIRGACVHQDFGGVGVALTDNLQYYKIKRLKEMGVNAYRGAHNPPSPVLLDACDELGMLVMDETRLFGTSPEALRQLTDLIERDRNHPSVIIWSLGNEEHAVQDTEKGAHLLKKATRIAKQLDPSRATTYGGNNGVRYFGSNSVAEVRGVNYIRLGGDDGAVWDKYHREHPDAPIIGTEESSYVLSRAGTVNDFEEHMLDCFGNVTMPWGSTPKGWVKFLEARDYFSGSFMWTGFDYRGEPSPFIDSNSSYFGTIDLCGMEKPPFYYYKAWWTDEPTLKLAPHWNYKEGERATVAVYTNCESIRRYLNGRLLEERKVERFDSPMFEVDFERGVLRAEGIYKGMTLHDELVTADKTENLLISEVLGAEGDSDVAIYEIEATDGEGRFCPLATDRIELEAEGGEIIGVGNGDPAYYGYERKPDEESAIYLSELYDGSLPVAIPPKKANERVWQKRRFYVEPKTQNFEDDYRIRRDEDTPAEKTAVLTANLRDVDGYEYIEFERLCGKATVYLNGEIIGDNFSKYGATSPACNRPYRFYCSFKEGDNLLKIEAKYRSENDLPTVSGYVKVGRVEDTPWHVRLHYGKCRVFVKYKDKSSFKLKANLI